MSIERTAGILLPISSLPSPYGIGTLGKEAYRFVDFLVKARQTYWQILPIGPTSYGDSPYQSLSSYAGNPYFIDPDLLVEEGLLEKKDLRGLKANDQQYVDYSFLFNTRFDLLYKAYRKGMKKFRKDFDSFREENNYWLENYSLFMAVKKHFSMASWQDWPDREIRERRPEAVERYKKKLADDIRFYQFIQFLFTRQYLKLKEYANIHGIRIIGDMPIYVALDSAEVWADSRQFKLDEETKVPKEVAGVPPDYFSKDGQLWGNPLYDWKYMKETGYKWWIDRVGGLAKYFDVIRLDHFRGFHEYWCVPYGDATARNGHWEKGPGLDFVKTIRNWFKDTEFIAEDLGIINEDVTKLLNDSGLPGMRVLEFGFAPDGTSYHCPHNHIQNCVCYVSTHDNTPIMGCLKYLKKKDMDYAKRYYGLNEEEGYNYGFIRGGMSSVCNLFVAQLQDYLGLDESATINNPGTLGNWRWRALKSDLNAKLASRIAQITHTYRRDGNYTKVRKVHP